MNQWVDQYDYVGDVRGIGLSIGIDIVKDKQSKERAEEALKICNYCFEHGVVIIAVWERLTFSTATRYYL